MRVAGLTRTPRLPSAKGDSAEGEQGDSNRLGHDDGHDGRDDRRVASGDAAAGAPAGSAEVCCGGSQHVEATAASAGPELVLDRPYRLRVKDRDDDLGLIDKDGCALGGGLGDIAEPVRKAVATLGISREGHVGVGREAVGTGTRRDVAGLDGAALDDEVIRLCVGPSPIGWAGKQNGQGCGQDEGRKGDPPEVCVAAMPCVIGRERGRGRPMSRWIASQARSSMCEAAQFQSVDPLFKRIYTIRNRDRPVKDGRVREWGLRVRVIIGVLGRKTRVRGWSLTCCGWRKL
jgi:hypothetical protein